MGYIYTEQKYKHYTFVYAPIFHELNCKIENISIYTKDLFLSNIVCSQRCLNLC